MITDMNVLRNVVDEIKRHSVVWVAFFVVFGLFYVFYYFFTPVYVYVVSSPFVGPSMINGFSDAYNEYSHSLMPVRVVDFTLKNTEKDVDAFVKQVKLDMASGRRVVAIVGTDISSETKLLLSAMTKHGMHIPVISQSSSSPELKNLYPWFFRIIYNDEPVVKAFARWYTSNGPNKPVIVLVDSENITWSGEVARVFMQNASSVVVAQRVIDMSDPFMVKNTIDAIVNEYRLNKNDVYIFIVDYKRTDLYKAVLALSGDYKNFLMTDSAVKYMFTRWFPDSLNLYVYYLPVDHTQMLDYDYDLSYDALAGVLSVVTHGARSSDAVIKALLSLKYQGRTGTISFVERNHVYERQFQAITILKAEGEIWRIVSKQNLSE